MVKAILLSQISRYKRNWTENAVCLTGGGITTRQLRSARSDAASVPDTSPGAREILFKITVTVADVQEVGYQLLRVTGVSLNCCFTVG